MPGPFVVSRGQAGTSAVVSALGQLVADRLWISWPPVVDQLAAGVLTTNFDVSPFSRIALNSSWDFC
jgi:hypothetical protein